MRFNDINKEKIARLKAHIEKEGLDKLDKVTIIYSNEDYHDALSQTVDEIAKFKSQKAFVFIDPYGYKEVRISDIKCLLETTKSEVLLFLPTQFMFRFEAKGTPESLIEFITELMPREKWPKSETGIDFIENLTDAFRNTLPDKFVDSFIITREKNQFFCLFFFTSHIYGFDRMLDAKWKIDEEDGRGWQYEDANNLFAQVEKQPNTIKFEKNLLTFLKQPRSNSEAYEFTLHQGHLPTHAVQILMKLQDNGQLSLKRPDGTDGRKSSFYLNYDNYKNDRVTIKLK